MKVNKPNILENCCSAIFKQIFEKWDNKSDRENETILTDSRLCRIFK